MNVFQGLLPRSQRGATFPGQVMEVIPDPDDPGNPRIRVRLTDPRSDGSSVVVRPNQIESRPEPLANLSVNQIGVPITVPEGAPGSKSNPIRTGDTLEAVMALRDGRYVELESIEQVSTLLDELAVIAHQAEAMGEDAPNYDLCRVTVPGTDLFCVETMGVSRLDMPQLAGTPTPGSPADGLPKDSRGRVDTGPLFIEHLREKGFTVTEGMRPAAFLKASQSELVGTRVAEMMARVKEGDPTAIREIVQSPIFVTTDDYIVDGHHRWAAAIGMDAEGDQLGDVEMPVRTIDMPILDVLAEARTFAADMGIAPRGATYTGPRPTPDRMVEAPEMNERKLGDDLVMRLLDSSEGRGTIEVKREDGELAGQLHWNLSGVSHIGVRPDFQRQGIATAMYRWAKELDPDLKHGMVVSESARSWIDTLNPEEREQVGRPETKITPTAVAKMVGPSDTPPGMTWYVHVRDPEGKIQATTVKSEAEAHLWADTKLIEGGLSEDKGSSVIVALQTEREAQARMMGQPMGELPPRAEAPQGEVEYKKGAWVYDPKTGFSGQIKDWYNSKVGGVIVIDPFTGEKKYRRMHLLKSISGPGELPDGDPKNDLPEIAPSSTGQVTPNLAPLTPPPEWKSWAKGQKLQWVNQTMEADLAQLRGGQPMTFDLGSIDPEFNLKIANRYRDLVNTDPDTGVRIDNVVHGSKGKQIRPEYSISGAIGVAYAGTVHPGGIGPKVWPSAILLNKEWFNEPWRWERTGHTMNHAMAAKGKRPHSIDEMRADPTLVLAHEFGHQVQYRYLDISMKDEGKFFSDVSMPDGFGEVPASSKWDETQELRYTIQKTVPTNYGRSKSSEAYAEAVTARYTGDANDELVGTLARWEELMELPTLVPPDRVEPSNRRPYTDLTPEERDDYWGKNGYLFANADFRARYPQSAAAYDEWLSRQATLRVLEEVGV